MVGIELYRVTVSQLATNCYILKQKRTRNALVIDPGADYGKIKEKLDSINAACKVILLTHGHFDHIFAVDDLRNKLTRVGIFKDDEHMLYEKDVFTTMVPYDPRPLYPADVVFDHEGRYKIDEFEFNVIHTPGHTKGSCVYVFEDCMFTGDTLFRGAAGTVLFGGDEDELNESLRRLYNYPGDYAVFPGHESPTTLSDERESNPYMRRFKR